MENFLKDVIKSDNNFFDFTQDDLDYLENLFLYANSEVICELVQDAIETQPLPKIYYK